MFVTSKADSLGNLGKVSFDYIVQVMTSDFVETQSLLHTTCSIAVLLNKKRAVLFFVEMIRD